jgi:hypothetical protein
MSEAAPGSATGYHASMMVTHAPYAVALAADVSPSGHASDSELGTGRFILLHDPEEPDAWGGAFRIVCFAQAPLETDMGTDPFLADVAWSYEDPKAEVDAIRGRLAFYPDRVTVEA